MNHVLAISCARSRSSSRSVATMPKSPREIIVGVVNPRAIKPEVLSRSKVRQTKCCGMGAPSRACALRSAQLAEPSRLVQRWRRAFEGSGMAEKHISAAEEFIAARDFLLRHREDCDTACRDFRWPQARHFNWALDYFDVMAEGNARPALWIVNEDGSEFKASFAEMRTRANRTANFLRALGVKRGDRILLMLGNVPALWEVMLAAMKIGAALIPSTTLLNREDLLDRLARGRVTQVIAAAEETGKFADLPGSFTRIVVGADTPGWTNYRQTETAPAAFVPEGVTAAADPLLLYFTSGTTAKAKLVLHTHASYPVGHLSTMYWLGLRPDDIHLNISSPGWAKHAWSCFFAPWNAGATIFVYA